MISKRAKRIAIWVALIFLLLALFSFVSSNVDYRRVDKGKRPLFSVALDSYEDGGTERWTGFGYSLMSMHRFATVDEENVAGFTVGPVLEYWIPVWPFRNKQNTRYEPFNRPKNVSDLPAPSKEEKSSLLTELMVVVQQAESAAYHEGLPSQKAAAAETAKRVFSDHNMQDFFADSTGFGNSFDRVAVHDGSFVVTGHNYWWKLRPVLENGYVKEVSVQASPICLTF